ncbi:MAG: MBL fold metallo-hydrolase [Moritella sp.]|uniref:MBL fold metallo-hydrolase n=1 Tax=Moritella sp. TaxID=78556 RepID=UPI00216F6C99|nr:MBL fold metallo-hydrolase [Moritella sp.]MBL1418351.1 MBL fold metallo-hydrolase [Moritella sp.]
MRNIGVVLMMASTLVCSFNAAAKANFSVINTGQSAGSSEGLIVSGGDWFKKRQLVHNAILIQHEQGDLLIDTGLGREVEQQVAAMSWLNQQLFAYTKTEPVIDQLQQQGYDFNRLKAIIPTHLHWDHASGIEDFKALNTPVWVQENELETAKKHAPPAFIQSQFDDPAINWHFIELNSTNTLGFAACLDVFDDGSVILIDMSGHTHGQLGVLVNNEYLFIGDSTWSIAGVNNNVGRSALVKWLVDLNYDQQQSDNLVEKLHQLSIENKKLVIVPAHDEIVAATLPRYPKFLM